MLCPGFAVSDEPGFSLYSSLLHALGDGDVPHEVSEQYVLCYFRFSTPQPAEFEDAFTETARALGRAGLRRQRGPAGGFGWARSAGPSWDGTAGSN
jgi:hypothetical protein